MAHEINNPLGFITSNVSTLSDYSETLINTMEQVEQDKDAVVDFIHSSDYEFIKSDHTDLVQETLEGLTRVKKLVEAMRSYSSIDTLSEKLSLIWLKLLKCSDHIFKSCRRHLPCGICP